MNDPNVVGFEVHFNDDETTDEDKNKARECGVPYQHTTIILDKSGNVAFKSLSPLNKDEITAKLAQAAW